MRDVGTESLPLRGQVWRNSPLRGSLESRPRVCRLLPTSASGGPVSSRALRPAPAADGREGLDVFPAAQTRELLLPASRHREALASDTLLINRRRYILHPRGVKFTSASVAGDSPTNAELETAANWVRVFETKNVRIVAIEHNN